MSPKSPKGDRKAKEEQLAEVTAAILYEKCKRDPLFWLQYYVYTVKEHRAAGEPALQLFPVRQYVKPIVEKWLDNKILHIVKSRQMGLSWLALAMLLWECQFYDYGLCVVINMALVDSINGLDRIKTMYAHQPSWLKNLCPLDRKLKDMPKECLTFENRSKIQALPQGADKVRGLVPVTALIDEASYLDELEATYGACVPCCKRIVVVSSAGPGFFERLCTT